MYKKVIAEPVQKPFRRMQNYEDFILKIIQNNVQVLQSADPLLLDDDRFMLKAVQTNGLALEFASDRLKATENIVLRATQNNGMALVFADKIFRYRKDIILAAVSSNKKARREYIPTTLRNDLNFMLQIMRIDGLFLEHLSKQLKDNDNIVLQAVQNNGLALDFASHRLKSDKSIVRKAVENNLFALKSADYNLQDDKKFIAELVEKYGLEILKYTWEDFRKDKEFIAKALRTDLRNYNPANNTQTTKEILEQVVQKFLELPKYNVDEDQWKDPYYHSKQ